MQPCNTSETEQKYNSSLLDTGATLGPRQSDPRHKPWMVDLQLINIFYSIVSKVAPEIREREWLVLDGTQDNAHSTGIVL